MPRTPVVTVVDYGMGNIHSLVSAIEYVGGEVSISGEPSKISRARLLILPGVGSFPAAMSAIQSKGLDTAIYEAIDRPDSSLLGICLGMQLLGGSSTEAGGAFGLGVFDFEVRELEAAQRKSLALPHIGFNSVLHNRESLLFRGMGESADYYFVHEFHCVSRAIGLNESHSNYGETFVAAIDNGKVFGTQFHPEKSQTNGLKVLRNFLRSSV